MGSQLNDRYKLIRLLGAGSTGEVWLAEHIHLGRQEAVKILREDLASDRELVGRFRREARAVNRLHHPSIVSIYDFGQLADGRLYLAMEFVAGEDLRAIIHQQGRLPSLRAMRILVQLADAIAHAHELGVIHRDLKPENLILTQHRSHSELIKVLDFGLAKVLTERDELTTTRRGSVFGTPEYIAPEQFSGASSDARIDIYSFGCIAFELLTGHPPFTGRPMAVLDAHVNRRPPRPTEARPEAKIPAELEAVVLGCLEKEPSRRFQRAREIVAALKAVPSYTPEKSDSGRRSFQSIPHGDEATEERTFGGGWFQGAPDKTTTGTREESTDRLVDIDVDLLRSEYETQLGDLAGALLDGGASDIELILAHTDFTVILQHVVAVRDELTELGRRSLQVEQQAREQESRLRFMLGEIRFEIDNLPNDATLDSALLPRIKTLENQLLDVLKRRDREIALLSDREVVLAAELADREEALGGARRKLADAVGGQLVSFSGSPQIRGLHQRILDRRELLRVMGIEA